MLQWETRSLHINDFEHLIDDVWSSNFEEFDFQLITTTWSGVLLLVEIVAFL